MSKLVAIIVSGCVTWLAAAVMSRQPPWKGSRIFEPEHLAWRTIIPIWLAMFAGWTAHNLLRSHFPDGNGDIVPMDWLDTVVATTAATIGVFIALFLAKRGGEGEKNEESKADSNDF
jgi:hypothetical protein